MPIVRILQALESNSEPSSDLLQRCLGLNPQLSGQQHPAAATPLEERARSIEMLKMFRPREAATLASAWLEETAVNLNAQSACEKTAGDFCSALSTWGGIQRNLGQLDDATLATHHALKLLDSGRCDSRTGFALQRAAYVLADRGLVAEGLEAAQMAVETHDGIKGGEHGSGIASIGLGVFHLFYRRDSIAGRLAFSESLLKLPKSDPLMVASASHGVVHSYLMEEKVDEALESLLALESYLPNLPEHVRIRCQWLKAEIAAASGEIGLALAIYRQLFPRATDVMEASGPVLLSFDWAKLLLQEETAHWRALSDALEPIARKLTRPERVAIEPYLDALTTGDLDSDLLDQTVVAFKTATNRMTLGMGRSGGAGKPEVLGQWQAA